MGSSRGDPFCRKHKEHMREDKVSNVFAVLKGDFAESGRTV